MARKGTLAPGKKLIALMKNDRPRCQFVKAPVEGAKYGEQCKNPCILGRPRCRYHGGKAGRPPTTHKYSKYHPVPSGLQAKFENALNDVELLNLSKEIALVTAQIWKIAEDAQSRDNFTDIEAKKLMSFMKHQKELIGQETQRRVSIGNMLSVEQVMIILKYVYDSVCRNIPDVIVRARIGADIRKVVGGEGKELTQT